MSTIMLEEYSEFFKKIDPELKGVLDSTFHDAARVISPPGLKDYMDGAKALCGLGRGNDLVVAYLEVMPQIAKECGEDIIPDCVTVAMKISSMTSGEVISLLFANLPTVARHLGDAQLVREYLALVHQLASTAARGLGPMFTHIDELLSKLTLSGLRRWANFGVQIYRKDFNNLMSYFSLESAYSRAMFERECTGVLFVKVQRKLNFYLRALWGRDFLVRPAGADYTDFRPYVENRILHVADALDDIEGIQGLEVYRATVSHMAAHMMYTNTPMSTKQLSPSQMFFIGLLEDARVEYKASKVFPGLKKLWRSLMVLEYDDPAERNTIPILEYFALQLLDDKVTCDDEQLNQFAEKFHSEIEVNQDNNHFSWVMGVELCNIFANRKAIPSLIILESYRIFYRDDNRIVWRYEDINLDVDVDDVYLTANQRQLKYKGSSLMMDHETDSKLAGDGSQEIWTCPDIIPAYEDDLVDDANLFNEEPGNEPISSPYHYHEWDYKIHLHRPDWVTIFERRPSKGDPEDIDKIFLEHKPISHRIRHVIDLLSPSGVKHQRGMLDGDEVDINAAIDAMVAIRIGEQPNTRVTMRKVLNTRDLSVVVLLDLSESTNDMVGNSDKTILDLTREAATLVSTAIDGIGDAFALHGFASDGRHDVQYFRLKDFNQHFDDDAKSRLAGIKGGLSTRMGAALRHAGYHLLKQKEKRKLILLVTDGEPSDIDETDPQYLSNDTKKAVEELYSNGVLSYCLTLDPSADDYVKRIFGVNNYTVIDDVNRLPEQLPLLFASLTS